MREIVEAIGFEEKKFETKTIRKDLVNFLNISLFCYFEMLTIN